MNSTNEALIEILLRSSTIQSNETESLNLWWTSDRIASETLGAFLIRQGVFMDGAARVLDLCRLGYLKIEDSSSLLHTEGRQRLDRGLAQVSRTPRSEPGSTTRLVPTGPSSRVVEETVCRQPKVGEMLGRCLLVGEIGRGPLGVVFRAFHVELKLSVNVMVPADDADAAAVARFESKARAMSQLDHPNIVRVLDYGDEPCLYLVTEDVEGVSLRDLIRQAGRLQVEPALAIILQVARGLADYASLGIVQGDVRPSKIVLTVDGLARLNDCGTAEFESAECETSAYLSPEQARGETPDLRSDLYGLGATFYHALTGSPPMVATSRAELLDKLAHETPTPVASLVPEIHPAISDLIARMMAKSPADRFDDFARVITQLEAISRDPRGFLTTPPAPSGRRLRAGRTRKLMEI